MSATIYRHLAAYNRWANARIYGAALAISDEAYRHDAGVFFGSLHATLNHLLLTDRIWLDRLTGAEKRYHRLDLILFEDRAELTRARLAEDDRLEQVIGAYDDEALLRSFAYANMAGAPFEQPLWETLSHILNHQTHHRGHAHACCSIATGTEPPSLDMVAFQRGAPAPDLRALI